MGQRTVAWLPIHADRSPYRKPGFGLLFRI